MRVESKVDGFEVSLNGKITNKWDISAGYSYLDSEITKAAYNAVAQEGKPLPFVAKTVQLYGQHIKYYRT